MFDIDHVLLLLLTAAVSVLVHILRGSRRRAALLSAPDDLTAIATDELVRVLVEPDASPAERRETIRILLIEIERTADEQA
jgi:hypothetical protein